MKRIGLFFGSFNPIHIGHIQLAETILNNSSLDEIWFVVSPHNPLKKRADLLDEQTRLHLVDIALHDVANMRSTDIEFSLPKPSYTVNTLRTLSDKYQDCQFSLIIGSDNLKVFDHWRDYDYILANYPIIVYPREGDDMQSLTSTYPMVNVINAPLLPISSTQIRAMLSAQPSRHLAQQWLNNHVWDYIIEHNLY